MDSGKTPPKSLVLIANNSNYVGGINIGQRDRRENSIVNRYNQF
jgi:hypothetical protein